MSKSHKNTLTIAITTVLIIGSIIIFTNNSNSKDSPQESNSITQSTQTAPIRKVTAVEFEKEIQEEGAVILDIRTPQEFNSGRIQGAINLDYYDKDFEGMLAQLDPTKPYKLYCNSGNRSADALNKMKKLGFTNVTELAGGIVSWNKSKLPVCNEC